MGGELYQTITMGGLPTPVVTLEPSIPSAAGSRRDAAGALRFRAKTMLGEDLTANIARRSKFSPELVNDAKRFFERRLGRAMNEDEVRNFLGDISDYFMIFVK
jgi:hypothetical protein